MRQLRDLSNPEQAAGDRWEETSGRRRVGGDQVGDRSMALSQNPNHGAGGQIGVADE